MKLFYTVAAVDDLDRLRAFIAVSNPIAGRRIVNRLRDAAAQLTHHPLIGVATEQSPDIPGLVLVEHDAGADKDCGTRWDGQRAQSGPRLEQCPSSDARLWA